MEQTRTIVYMVALWDMFGGIYSTQEKAAIGMEQFRERWGIEGKISECVLDPEEA